jgi:hypothetical protein
VERQHSPEYRVVAVYGCLADAEVVRGVLEADGIAAAVFEGTDASLLPGADRAVRVLVPSDDLGRARDLIATPAEPLLPDDTPDEIVAPAPRLERAWTVLWLALIGATLVALAAAAL